MVWWVCILSGLEAGFRFLMYEKQLGFEASGHFLGE